MNEELERKLNTSAYVIIIIVEIIYIYVTNNQDNLGDEKANNLVKLGRFLLFITSLYFIINALIGYKGNKSTSQYKQVVAVKQSLSGCFDWRLAIQEGRSYSFQ
jgi:hypothetical protein